MPYTEALLKARPRLDAVASNDLDTIPGRPPDPRAMPKGCRFATRCQYAQPRCRAEAPPLSGDGDPGHRFACWYPVGTPAGTEALAKNRTEGRVAAAAVADVGGA
jgi:peptide/nickel transport system ATP-binding protein